MTPRIGIIGGLGPLAGVELQRQIIAATPATTDQEHIEVVCFTNPHVADRTSSLAQDAGDAFVRDITRTIRVLERAGVTLMLLPCNTAHARFSAIQKRTTVPILNMVQETVQLLRKQYGESVRPLLCATDGTIGVRVYETYGPDINWCYLQDQQMVMDSIYAIKAGRVQHSATVFAAALTDEMRRARADVAVLACTELSVIADAVTVPHVDPLRIVAVEAVARVFETKKAPVGLAVYEE